MAKPQKESNDFTTISVRKIDKSMMRQHARYLKNTKNGILYESDAVIFNRMVVGYTKDTPQATILPKPTYPTKQKNIDIPQAKSQQD